ncbi:LysM peptidoglycan-binding domain-containing protein [Paenibacillus humicola]|uniref:LysM peptidoglycan-binding domain-containing protein n=1 Tax=Paenibacillus humicola TaxID=3110540 RepID=UPI00237C0404|nr:LysM peptidoglycan-binding domain-containing protein [Paenibacillus humicola]
MPISPGTHLMVTVLPGDTLYAIANRYGTNVPAITQANALYPPVTDPGLIYPGQLLLLRLPGMSQTSAVLYQVAQGDNLFRIGERFSAGADMLASLNQLQDPNLIRVGQQLFVPAFVYEVAPGDTFYGISRRFGASMSELARANRGRPGWSPDVLYPGFQLAVPYPSSTNIAVFEPMPGATIASGQQLSGVARAFEANVLYQLRDASGRSVIPERFVTAAEGAPAFGRFNAELRFAQTPAARTGTLLVYTRSARDGSIQDMVEVPVRF